MKKILALCAVLFVTSLLAAGAARAEKLKIAVLNMPKIYKDLPEVQKVTLYLKKRKEDFQKELDEGTKELYGLMKEIKEGTGLSDDERKQREAKWRRMKFDLDLKFQKYKDDLQKLEKREFDTLKEKIDAAIQRVVRAKRLDLVLEKQWLYFGDAIDITDEVLGYLGTTAPKPNSR